MELSPENTEKLKKVALAGAALALASAALRHNKVIGEKLRLAGFWEASESVVLDIIDDGKSQILRLAGRAVRNENGEVIDVELDEGREYSDSEIAELEQVFLDSGPTRVSN
ncbi:hypothetical protein HYU82_02600 [Candidatus Saccharibacteria bacterium]|nr:hypothetical protein [Candidatus Saccharibacteria bacterium]MBI2285687.1 hypothetical protein [Candidatus Saccharibacteria bacterium]